MNYQLNSRLDHSSVTAELKHAVAKLKANTTLNISLSNITKIDSSGIALLIELKAIANTIGHKLRYDNYTDEILKLCSLYSITL